MMSYIVILLWTCNVSNMLLRSVPFWNVMQGEIVPKCLPLTTNLCCITCWKSKDLIYPVAKAWNQA